MGMLVHSFPPSPKKRSFCQSVSGDFPTFQRVKASLKTRLLWHNPAPVDFFATSAVVVAVSVGAADRHRLARHSTCACLSGGVWALSRGGLEAALKSRRPLKIHRRVPFTPGIFIAALFSPILCLLFFVNPFETILLREAQEARRV